MAEIDPIKRAELLERLKQPNTEQGGINEQSIKFPVVEQPLKLPVSVELTDIENEIDVVKLNIQITI